MNKWRTTNDEWVNGQRANEQMTNFILHPSSLILYSSPFIFHPSSFVFCLFAFLIACAPAPARIVVQWTTATEINTAGFNVYRAERAEGPYAKLNAQLIPASDALIGGKYQYADTTVVAGRTYYYQLEDVEYGGATARHGPIIITASGALGFGELVLVGAGALMIGAAVWLAQRRAGLRASRSGK
ncbi:MAG: hypothetical protein FJ009_07945 [Chloroflexi bacterium]|nr:hypothetical protein [Chloroflexota bacterium]